MPSPTAYYDTLGRLAEYDTSVSTRFLYDGDRVTAELDNQGAVNPVKRRYVWGAGEDELVAWYEGMGNATRRFVVQDERASIVAVSDSAGALVGINRYDEYGIPAPTNIGRFQYTGQAFLAEAGLHHYKARAYSPTLGRFLQTDPIGYKDGINWYDYVDGDPVNRVDSDGKAAQDIADIFVGAAKVFAGGAGVLAGATIVAGSGALEAITVGGATPVAVPAALGGAAAVVGSAAVATSGVNQILKGLNGIASEARGNQSRGRGGKTNVRGSDGRPTKAGEKADGDRRRADTDGRPLRQPKPTPTRDPTNTSPQPKKGPKYQEE